MIFKPFDVVELPFPFADFSTAKLRKALVISSQAFNEANKAITVAMITSAKNSEWFGDIKIQHWEKAGLKKPCYVRFKFFTADKELFLRRVGSLHKLDVERVRAALNQCLL